MMSIAEQRRLNELESQVQELHRRLRALEDKPVPTLEQIGEAVREQLKAAREKPRG